MATARHRCAFFGSRPLAWGVLAVAGALLAGCDLFGGGSSSSGGGAAGPALINLDQFAVTGTATPGTCIMAGSSDPLFAYQWHFANGGNPSFFFSSTAGVSGKDINFTTTTETGCAIKIAVVDSGMEIAHEDLSDNIVAAGSVNFNTATTDPTNPTSTGDHGTSVAGLIGARKFNSLGGRGVAGTASLVGYNFVSSNQANAYELAAMGGKPFSSNVAIFNQSYGIDFNGPLTFAQTNPSLEAQLRAGVTSGRGGNGNLYVKAAGNGFHCFGACGDATVNTDVCYVSNLLGLTCQNANMDPTNTLPYEIIVGALAASGARSSYSSIGSNVWISAPGGEFGGNAVTATCISPSYVCTSFLQPAMVTTDQSGCAKGYSSTARSPRDPFDDPNSLIAPHSTLNASCNYASSFNGTSSATPVMSGVVALLLEANSSLTWRDVKHILAATAVSSPTDATLSCPAVSITLGDGSYTAEPGWITNHGSPNRQFSNCFGFGRVNVAAALAMAKATPYAPSYLNPFGTFVDTGYLSSVALNLLIPDNSIAGASSTITVNTTTPVIAFVEAVQIMVTIPDHPYDGDIGLELTSPGLTKSVLLNINNGYVNSQGLSSVTFLSNAFYGEAANGTWTLKAVDGASGFTGHLTNWQIRIFGH